MTNTSTQNIFRFKFTDDLLTILYEFSKKNEFATRHQFKKEWQEWLEENSSIVNIEIDRLKKAGYNGDVIDKMFKSSRYYLRKKDTEKKTQVQRRDYVGLTRETLQAIDHHIQNNKFYNDSKPSVGFDNFCLCNIELLKNEISNLINNHNLSDKNYIKNKIKKTYKNRYFIYKNECIYEQRDKC